MDRSLDLETQTSIFGRQKMNDRISSDFHAQRKSNRSDTKI
jgi:hypothetical protein